MPIRFFGIGALLRGYRQRAGRPIVKETIMNYCFKCGKWELLDIYLMCARCYAIWAYKYGHGLI